MGRVEVLVIRTMATEWGNLCAPSCRDSGRGWVDEGALCLSWWECDSSGFREAGWLHPNEDKHKAPTLPLILPLSLQDGSERFS